mgnify:FL=1
MEKILGLFFVLLLSSCATLNEPPGTVLMTSDQKIQYYQEQISHYQFLIEQEKKKQAEKANK